MGRGCYSVGCILPMECSVTEEPPKNDEIYPNPPDLQQVDALRTRLRAERAEMNEDITSPQGRMNRSVGKRAKDLGAYTLIPSLMMAGPFVGYAMGRFAERYIEIEPWGAVVGMLVGMAAAFREVFLLLKRKQEK